MFILSWAIAKKSIGAAKVVNNAIKDVDEIYSNEFGTRKMTSFFDSIENEKRATQVITDELPDDMKLLYKQPEQFMPMKNQHYMTSLPLTVGCVLLTPTK